jgi:hypothetical protein
MSAKTASVSISSSRSESSARSCEKTRTRKRRRKKTSGASSLDPHLIPPPRHGGGGQKQLHPLARIARTGTQKAKRRPFMQSKNSGGRALARPPAAPHPQLRPTLLKRGCSPIVLIRAAAHRPLNQEQTPEEFLLIAPAAAAPRLPDLCKDPSCEDLSCEDQSRADSSPLAAACSSLSPAPLLRGLPQQHRLFHQPSRRCSAIASRRHYPSHPDPLSLEGGEGIKSNIARALHEHPLVAPQLRHL